MGNILQQSLLLRYPVLLSNLCKTIWWRHQMETFSALLASCVGNSLVTDEFPTQRPVTGGLMFCLICAWINVWVNNGEAGDWRQHDVTVMCEYWTPVWEIYRYQIFKRVVGTWFQDRTPVYYFKLWPPGCQAISQCFRESHSTFWLYMLQGICFSLHTHAYPFAGLDITLKFAIILQ